MSVGEVCNRAVVVADKEEDAQEAARLMRQYHVGDLVVVERRGDENIPLGVVTDRDLVIEVLAKEVEPVRVTVKDLIGEELVTAAENEDLLTCIERMRSKGIRRLPVVSQTGALVGLLTLDDLLDLLSEELEDLAALIARQRNRESKLRP